MEDYLASLMNQEFDTLVEDGSMAKVCACVCVRVCVRACVCACLCACVCVSVEWFPVRGVILIWCACIH